jgi:hypothetical protein
MLNGPYAASSTNPDLTTVPWYIVSGGWAVIPEQSVTRIKIVIIRFFIDLD